MLNVKAKNKRMARGTIQSLERGLMLLEYVVNTSKAVELAELAKVLGIEKSSTHRLMATLISHGYIIQDSQKHYLAGPSINELASKAKSRLQLSDVAGRYLNELAKSTGETAHIGILSRGQVILTHNVSSNHTLTVVSRVGHSEPLHCTSLGKALLCGMNENKINSIAGRGKLKAYTKNTITSVSKLIKECEKVRTTGMARDDEEFREGVRCLAAPVRDAEGKIIAAIGVSGPASRFTGERFERAAEQVRNIGYKLSAELGYSEI